MNIYQPFSQMAEERKNATALIHPKNGKSVSWTFAELDQAIHSFCHFFHELGIKPQDKVLLFVRPGLRFPAITFALFKMGAVPVLIDPGMGKKNLLASVQQVKPVVMIAEPVVFFLKHFYPESFSSVRLGISTGSKLLADYTLMDLNLGLVKNFPTYEAAADEMSAILFTSGGTGIPKGVIYTHKILDTQRKMLQQMFQLTSHDIDLPCFPLFALFTISMGMTSCIPEMNPSKPSKVNPKKIVQNILQFNPTFLAGSPAIWEKVGEYCHTQKITLPSVKYLVMFGAPVSVQIHQLFAPLLTNGTTYTPYGATESLPVSNISGKDVLEKTAKLSLEGKGTCVGKPVEGSRVCIYDDSEIPEPRFIEGKKKKAFEVGEILVQGDIATKEYFDMKAQTELHKIYDEEKFWHRIGDLGYFDDEGKLWFCGRKSHKVNTQVGPMYSIPCEAIFNQHPMVKRSALVGLGESGKEIPAIVIERIDHFMSMTESSQKKFDQELKDLGAKFAHTKMIQHFFLYDYFPVDVRHNIKIDRLKLKSWANSHWKGQV
ncbi:MAG: fatty acid CoA ligase family protein [Bacteriovoracaceae bacterium]